MAGAPRDAGVAALADGSCLQRLFLVVGGERILIGWGGSYWPDQSTREWAWKQAAFGAISKLIGAAAVV